METIHSNHMWKCEQCETQVDDQFDACWKCGTSVDGHVEPEFRHADDCESEIPQRNRQFKLSELFLVLNAVAFVFAGWKTERSMVLIVGVLILVLMVMCQVIPEQINKWRRRIRDSNKI